ncbi:hypothetical protein [Paeniglutamicibacter antarcticus]|uniref:Uncharacterized protein n=1 Tax=Paeniglutamicibacter antarcticus TaxID=494023 RepID=A0ABP9TPW0_9MICC
MNTSPRSDPTFLIWAATVIAVAISIAAGWVALGTATGEIGPMGADGAPADVEFWAPIGWTSMAAVLPITVAAWKSARWGAIALAGATGVQVIVATMVIGRYADSDFNSGGLEGLIYLIPVVLGVVGGTSSLIAVMVRRHQAKG